MTKDQAALLLIREARSERASKSSYQRTSRVLKALGLADHERNAVLAYLDYIDPNTTEPYARYVR